MAQSDWCESWFNSPFYHVLYRDRNEEEAAEFLENIIRLLRPQKSQKFLDLACGRGRHAIFLNQKGFDVTGIDIAENSISEAKKFENDKLCFQVHDMREPFPENFDFVLNLFTSFGYFENAAEELQVLTNIREMLSSGGKLVMDYMNVAYVADNLVENETKTVGEITFYISRRIEGGFILKDIRFEHEGRQHTYEEKVRAISPGEFIRLFNATGFQIINTFGDYKLTPFNPTTSPRHILYAQFNE